MESCFIDRHQQDISGVLSCCDRIVFRGHIRPIQYAGGLMKFLNYQNVLLKDFGAYAKSLGDQIKAHAKASAEKHGRPYEYLRSPKVSKEEIARNIAQQDGIEQGLVCVLGCVELCPAFDIYRNKQAKKLELVSRWRKCLYVYFYFMDRRFGLTYIRLQTWFPFQIQIGCNGHEYLARQLDKAGIAYEKQDNCFTHISDLKKAQRLADCLLKTNWVRVLDRFARVANPLLSIPPESRPGQYYWVVHQSEYATDVMFKDAHALEKIYPQLTHHAIQRFDADRVMRFLGKKLRSDFQGEVTSHFTRRPEGVCVKHYVNKNSIKMYDKAGSVLRIETTINNPKFFRVYRETSGESPSIPKWMPMRKGVADFWRRAQVAKCANQRYLDALSVVGNETPSCKILDDVSRRVKKSGLPYRPLHPVAPDDAAFFRAILRGEHLIHGFRNQNIQRLLYPKPATKEREKKRRSNHTGRRLRLFRAHGLIKKVPYTHYYRITKKGHDIMATSIAFRQTKLKLLKQVA